MTSSFDTSVKAKTLMDQIVQWRRTIHRFPELSFQEFKTAKLVAKTLQNIPGVTVETGIVQTGVIGTLSAGSGPTIALRADMDALPIKEQTKHSFRSQNEGVMHACGHDAHTATLLGTAHLLGDLFQQGRVQGTVKFIFQPAEEDTDEHGSTGAPYMVQAGVLDGVDAAIALHMDPENPVGTIRVNEGYSMANVDNFEGVLYGNGGHAAYPHLGTDPVWFLGSVLQALHGIVSRRVSPLDAAVVSVTQIEAGTANNVLPTEITLRGTLRSYLPEVRDLLEKEVEKAFSLATIYGGDYSLCVERGEPALKNDPDVNRWISQTISDLYPEFQMIHGPFGLGGEDFGWMAEKVPSAMFFLGCAMPDSIKRDLHTPIFDIDESCLPIGVTILSETVLRYLSGEYQLDK